MKGVTGFIESVAPFPIAQILPMKSWKISLLLERYAIIRLYISEISTHKEFTMLAYTYIENGRDWMLWITTSR